MSKEKLIFSVLNRGQSHQTSTIYQKLWNIHMKLVRRWRTIDSPQKFKNTKISSNSKSTAGSSKMEKSGKKWKKVENSGKKWKKVEKVEFENEDEIG